MALLRIVPLDAAHCAVNWRTVFLIAGLIPLIFLVIGVGAI